MHLNNNINIIRNCLHSNNTLIGVLLEESNLPVQIIKKTFSKDGVHRLKREIEGLHFFCNRVKQDFTKEVIKSQLFESYGFLLLKYHQGSTGDFYAPLHSNQKKFENIIDFYINNFRNSDVNYSHGDFSLGNIIFTGDQVKWIIDWENFNTFMPKEFDLIYCITENCLFRHYKKKLTPQDISTYHQLLKSLSKHMVISEDIRKRPASWCRQVVQEYIKQTSIDHSKCPFIASSDAHIKELDNLLK